MMRTVKIEEMDSGWYVADPDYTEGKFFKTAAEAFGSVTATEAERAEANGISAVCIEWVTVSRVGRIVAAAIAKAEGGEG